MASIVEIQAATTSVTCDPQGNAEHVVSIHNTTGRKLRVTARIHVDEPAKAEWVGKPVLQAKPKQQEWDLEPDETIQVTVPIVAKDAAAGDYTFRLEVYSTEAPSEETSMGDGIAFTVPEPPPVEPPVEKPFPWWIIVVIVAVLVIGGVSWFVISQYVLKTGVPSLIGMSRDDAIAELEAASLVLGTEEQRVSEDTESAGTVIEQDPDGGRLKKGSSVNVVFAIAPDLFRVESATLTASRTAYEGGCPVNINFQGQLTTAGTAPGEVTYAFARSDNLMSPPQSLNFAATGTQNVSSTWRVESSMNGWQQLVVSSPNEITSERANFSVRCVTPEANPAEAFLGRWSNVDAATRGITRVEITRSGLNLVVHMWGKCTPTDCDWGTVTTPVTDATDKVLKIKWVMSFKTDTQKLTLLPDGRLRVDSFTHYTDNSGRADRSDTYFFQKR